MRQLVVTPVTVIGLVRKGAVTTMDEAAAPRKTTTRSWSAKTSTTSH